MSDTLNQFLTPEATNSNIWRAWITEAKIFDITTTAAKVIEATCKVAVSNGLFRIIHPPADDQCKGESFEARLTEILQLFKRRVPFTNSPKYMDFWYTFQTSVKHYHSYDKVVTFSDGKKRDKKVHIFVTRMMDDTNKPALMFGVVPVKSN